jgi:hypothetical protein
VDLEHIDASRHQKSLSRIGGIEQQGEIRGWGGATHVGSREHKHGMLLLPAGEVAGGHVLRTSCDQHTPALVSTGGVESRRGLWLRGRLPWSWKVADLKASGESVQRKSRSCGPRRQNVHEKEEKAMHS